MPSTGDKKELSNLYTEAHFLASSSSQNDQTILSTPETNFMQITRSFVFYF